MKKKIAKISISNDLIKEVLHIPMNAEIIFVKKGNWNEIEMIVTHSDLKEVEINEGEEPPLITPLIHKTCGSFKFDWNQK
jgi:hypothetical protein